MINSQIINPQSIVVVGGSNHINKPGGSALKNLREGSFKGEIIVVNAKEDCVQGISTYKKVDDIPPVDMAIISIPASQCIDTTKVLISQKGVKAFVIFSAGFSEVSEDGARIERELATLAQKENVCILGPNCSGMFNMYHQSIFTQPIPLLSPKGVDMASASGGMATFIIENAILQGIRFSSVWSVGNAVQNGVEEILAYWDKSYTKGESSPIKLLYIENIRSPYKFLQHARSLVKKGCWVVALKSGISESGQRAASSHTGAIANSNMATEALLAKAGVIQCFSREEMVNICAVLLQKPIKGKNIGIISQAGGPAVVLTDALAKGGLSVPHIDNQKAALLKEKLLPGTSTTNPIDLLGTGTAQHLLEAIQHCLKYHHNELDALAVLYGNPGVGNVQEAYQVLSEQTESSPIPIYPILPSVLMAREEMDTFISKGLTCFTDEVAFANALARIQNCPTLYPIEKREIQQSNIIREIISHSKDGWLSPEQTHTLLSAAEIPILPEVVSNDKEVILQAASQMGFPVVLKVVGVVHKSDVGGVIVNIRDEQELTTAFDKIMNIPKASATLLQPMVSGKEIFIGAKYEENFGHILLCGLGGIFVDVLKDVSSALAPIHKQEALSMLQKLQSYPIIQGVRGEQGVNVDKLCDIIVKLSQLLLIAPEIKEIDLNPLIGGASRIIAADARILIRK